MVPENLGQLPIVIITMNTFYIVLVCLQRTDYVNSSSASRTKSRGSSIGMFSLGFLNSWSCPFPDFQDLIPWWETLVSPASPDLLEKNYIILQNSRYEYKCFSTSSRFFGAHSNCELRNLFWCLYYLVKGNPSILMIYIFKYAIQCMPKCMPYKCMPCMPYKYAKSMMATYVQ